MISHDNIVWTAKFSRTSCGTYGNGDGKDVSHTQYGKTVLEKASKNRARNRGKLKCSKSKKK